MTAAQYLAIVPRAAEQHVRRIHVEDKNQHRGAFVSLKFSRISLALFLLGIGFVALGADVWLYGKDPCLKGAGHHCSLATVFSNALGISRAVADAQYWIALGLACTVAGALSLRKDTQ